MEVYDLANIKSAKKRILVNRTKADRNKAIKSGVKTAIKKVYAVIATGDKEAAKAKLQKALEGRFSPLNYVNREMVEKQIASL